MNGRWTLSSLCLKICTVSATSHHRRSRHRRRLALRRYARRVRGVFEAIAQTQFEKWDVVDAWRVNGKCRVDLKLEALGSAAVEPSVPERPNLPHAGVTLKAAPLDVWMLNASMCPHSCRPLELDQQLNQPCFHCACGSSRVQLGTRLQLGFELAGCWRSYQAFNRRIIAPCNLHPDVAVCESAVFDRDAEFFAAIDTQPRVFLIGVDAASLTSTPATLTRSLVPNLCDSCTLRTV